MKAKTSLSFLVTAALMSFNTFAGNAVVEWYQPEKFADIKSNSGKQQEKYIQETTQELEEHFQKIAEKRLPENMTLVVRVTDLDMAGRVNQGRSGRPMDKTTYPSIRMDYALIENGERIHVSRTTFADQRYLERGFFMKTKNNYFYEKELITRWFNNEVKSALRDRNKIAAN